ncbi:MAG: hypothetical protein EOM91_08955 [Sphingobacteriia bacterium]|nr:hypothetical protein [Sphingobacteriia bacterium]NCC37934.1 hypothetical protein [Gammaproteobacteria bacterium]
MNQIKKTPEYRIFQKKSGRYAVRAKGRQWLHGEEKEKVLVQEELITRLRPKAAAPAEESAPAE